ncbi:hypothetical protein [Providencia huashanensis]|uniref:hypothetical protein n=1 Tax=Providencia huashanensis TaxID=3037798 RepID=UPI004045758C
MKKALITLAITLLLPATSFSESEMKLSDVASKVCADHDDKTACEGFINSAIVVAFEQGKTSGICDLMKGYGEKVKNEQRYLCEDAKKTEKDVRDIKY